MFYVINVWLCVYQDVFTSVWLSMYGFLISLGSSLRVSVQRPAPPNLILPLPPRCLTDAPLNTAAMRISGKNMRWRSTTSPPTGPRRS